MKHESHKRLMPCINFISIFGQY